MQLELSSRTETEQEARSKSSCYNFETLSTQIFQCNCFFSAATGPPPSYSSLRDNSRQHQSQRVEILFGGAFLFLFVCIFSTYSWTIHTKYVHNSMGVHIDWPVLCNLTLHKWPENRNCFYMFIFYFFFGAENRNCFYLFLFFSSELRTLVSNGWWGLIGNDFLS